MKSVYLEMLAFAKSDKRYRIDKDLLLNISNRQDVNRPMVPGRLLLLPFCSSSRGWKYCSDSHVILESCKPDQREEHRPLAHRNGALVSQRKISRLGWLQQRGWQNVRAVGPNREGLQQDKTFSLVLCLGYPSCLRVRTFLRSSWSKPRSFLHFRTSSSPRLNTHIIL